MFTLVFELELSWISDIVPFSEICSFEFWIMGVEIVFRLYMWRFRSGDVDYRWLFAFSRLMVGLSRRKQEIAEQV